MIFWKMYTNSAVCSSVFSEGVGVGELKVVREASVMQLVSRC